VVSKVLYLRQNYHFGPGKIGDYLRRFHRISLATATVHRILQRHGMARLPANQKHRQHTKRVEALRPFPVARALWPPFDRRDRDRGRAPRV
jgi:hypothetical protein